MEEPHQAFLGDALRHCGQGAVDGGQDHPEVASGQHHGKLGGLGLLRQKLGVARIVVARQLHGNLADGRGNHSRHLLRQRQINGGEDITHHGRAGGRGGAAVFQVMGGQLGQGHEVQGSQLIAPRLRAVRQVDFQGRVQGQAGPLQGGQIADDEGTAHLVNMGVGQGFDDDFRPHSHRIAQGQGQNGSCKGISHSFTKVLSR